MEELTKNLMGINSETRPTDNPNKTSQVGAGEETNNKSSQQTKKGVLDSKERKFELTQREKMLI
jgi:hypothetical protein